MLPLSHINLSNITDRTAPALQYHIIYRLFQNQNILKLLLPLLEYYETKINSLEEEIKNAQTC